MGSRKVGFLEGCSSHGQSIDGIGLAVLPRLFAVSGHHLGRDPHDPFAGSEQVPFQAAGKVSAVLDRPDPFAVELVGPDDQGQVISGGGVDGSLGEFPGPIVNGDDCVVALVRVDAKDQHGKVSSVMSAGMTSGWPVGIASAGR